MMLLSIYGRLGQDPRAIDTKSGKAMVVASIAVELADRSGEAVTQWLGIVAFGGLAEKLAAHSKGECLAVSGRAQHNSYQTSGGEQREQLQVIADSIISARTARPGGKRRTVNGSEAASPRGAGDSSRPFDDEIPF